MNSALPTPVASTASRTISVEITEPPFAVPATAKSAPAPTLEKIMQIGAGF